MPSNLTAFHRVNFFEARSVWIPPLSGPGVFCNLATMSIYSRRVSGVGSFAHNRFNSAVRDARLQEQGDRIKGKHRSGLQAKHTN